MTTPKQLMLYVVCLIVLALVGFGIAHLIDIRKGRDKRTRCK